MPGFYGRHHNSQELPERVEPTRTAYLFANEGILHLTLVEYVCVRLTGMLPKPVQVVEYQRAFRPDVRQVEFTVWTKEQEATQSIPKPKPPEPKKQMPHQQAKANPFQSSQYGSHMGGLGGYGNPFSSHEDV